eukprot:364987-Chlamydomonas_euryale.AAC.4
MSRLAGQTVSLPAHRAEQSRPRRGCFRRDGVSVPKYEASGSSSSSRGTHRSTAVAARRPATCRHRGEHAAARRHYGSPIASVRPGAVHASRAQASGPQYAVCGGIGRPVGPAAGGAVLYSWVARRGVRLRTWEGKPYGRPEPSADAGQPRLLPTQRGWQERPGGDRRAVGPRGRRAAVQGVVQLVREVGVAVCRVARGVDKGSRLPNQDARVAVGGPDGMERMGASSWSVDDRARRLW